LIKIKKGGRVSCEAPPDFRFKNMIIML